MEGCVTMMRIGLLHQNDRIIHQMNELMHKIQISDSQLSTGKKLSNINPADIIKISRLETEIRESRVAQENIQNGISLIQTMDEALSVAEEIGHRLMELANRFESESVSKEERKEIKKEAKGLFMELKNIFENTTFNGQKVFDKPHFLIYTGNQGYVKIDVPNVSHMKSIKSMKEISHKGLSPMNSNDKETSIPFKTEEQLSPQKAKSFAAIKAMATYNRAIEAYQKAYDFHKVVQQREMRKTASLSENILDNNQARFKHKEDIREVLKGQSMELLKKRVDEQGFRQKFRLKRVQEFKFFRLLEAKEKKSISTDNSTTPSTIPSNTEKTPQPKHKIPGILNTDFISKHILGFISEKRSELQIKERILNYRMEYQMRMNEIKSEQLERIESVDMAKEIANKVKNEMLLNINANLFHHNLEQRRQFVLQLLQSIG
jgi:flagellin